MSLLNRDIVFQYVSMFALKLCIHSVVTISSIIIIIIIIIICVSNH